MWIEKKGRWRKKGSIEGQGCEVELLYFMVTLLMVLACVTLDLWEE